MARRTMDVRSLVIVCEGSETEYRYFRDIKKYVERTNSERFVKIHVVPVETEIIRERNPERPIRGKLRSGAITQPHYWCLYEESQQDYEKYKAQPTRYVREAYLYMKQEGYTEAWAVYDGDVHPEHKTAYDYAQTIPNLNVAFSAYSFEEWLLAHFERNGQPFEHSECKINKKTIMCGTNQHPDDCHGTKCIAGRIREKNYIPDYTKNNDSIFEEYTLPRLNTAVINAAWLRHLSDNAIYERNPYTDVDSLVLYMLGQKENTYVWCSTVRPFEMKSLKLSLEYDGQCYMIRNYSLMPIVIKPLNLTYLDATYSLTESAVSSVQILMKGDSVKVNEPYPFVQYQYGDKMIIFDLRKLK